MKNLKIGFLALLSLVLVVSSCKKDDDNTPDDNSNGVKSADVSLSRKTDYGNDWIYYSLKEGKEVDVTDHMQSLSWDIAFNRYNVRTNGGESGSGQGSAYDAGKVDFSSLLEAAEGGYIVDDTILIVEEFLGQNVSWMISTGNDIFKGCIVREMGSQGPSFVPNDHIFVIKTAEGKYAKLWINGYYNSDGNSGYISFKYHYQSGEGRKLE